LPGSDIGNDVWSKYKLTNLYRKNIKIE